MNFVKLQDVVIRSLDNHTRKLGASIELAAGLIIIS